MKEFQPIADRPAPVQTVGPVAWIRENLFSSIGNSIVTGNHRVPGLLHPTHPRLGLLLR